MVIPSIVRAVAVSYYPRKVGGILKLKKRLALLTTAACFFAASAFAQTFPDKPIKLIVGFPAGGPTDGPARVIAEKLRVSLGQPVIVENKPGAGGKIAVDYILGQPRDGYTLLFCTYIDPINTVLYKKSSYSIDDLAPISLATNAYYAFVVANDLPVNSVQEFIAYAKAHPDRLNYGHVGAGSAPELVIKRFEKVTGIKTVGVPFRGMGDALQEIVAGRVQFAVGPLVVATPLYEAGRLKVLGMTSPQRLAVASHVPTLQEQGVPIVANTWLGMCAAKGTPQAVIKTLNGHVAEAIRSREYQTLMEKTGLIGVSSSPEEMDRVMRETARDAGELIVELGLQKD
jgi:tripartite-type tricarboxylate transporter receptor subunit TctC